MQEAVWLAKVKRYRLRNDVILRLLYSTAIRRTELCGLSWRHTLEREDGKEQITVFGKEAKQEPPSCPRHPGKTWPTIGRVRPMMPR